ncbi:OB-fold-containig protein [uncultured Erythrobacter sp.]|uniref:OB-fold-containig protein n=1 Tax=uncultured Erythrobacter sp. TaxID=263913 RepID=UPI002617C5AC|nr:OB-fold-containig protein [uncultured Erythrobacter sp.]
MTLLEAYNLPFAAAAILLVFIALAQVIGMGDMFEGADADIDLDVDIEADPTAAGGFFDALQTVFGIGRVPFLIWLSVLLFTFTVIGVVGQQVLVSTLGAPFPAWLAAIGAGAAALPVTGALTRPLARLLPQDESSAVGLDSLVRRDAEIQLGEATAGSPARSKVIDRHGHPHFVMVEPNDPEATLKQGETVMLVRREGQTFFGVQYENPMLSLR